MNRYSGSSHPQFPQVVGLIQFSVHFLSQGLVYEEEVYRLTEGVVTHDHSALGLQ